MGTFTISSKRDQDAEALTATVDITDADIDRITTAYGHIYFSGGVIENGQTRSPTGTEVFNAVANGLLQGLIANTLSQEQAQAAQAAQAAVTPIAVGPISNP